MKIVIPAKGKNIEDGVCESFGRAPYFIIYDSDKKDYEAIENIAAKAQGGAGIKAGQLVVDTGAKALITPRCGENAALVINKAGIKIYKSEGTSIMDNVNALIADELESLNEIHAGFHGQGV